MRSQSLYKLKPRFVDALNVVTDSLTIRGTTPNTVTLTAIPVAAAGATAVALGTIHRAFWLLIPLCALGLMAINAIDGSLARSTGQITTRGAVLNELVDRLGDLLLLGSLAAVAPPALVGVALVLVLTAEVVALIGWGALGQRALLGVMGKPDRALTISVGAIFAAFTGPEAFTLSLILIIGGAALTTVSRIHWVITEPARLDTETSNVS